MRYADCIGYRGKPDGIHQRIVGKRRECLFERIRQFIIKRRAEKTARNISKNTTIIIPAHNIPAFKSAKEFTDLVSKLKD